MSERLHEGLARLQESLIHGKLPRSLRWNQAVELMAHLGKVEARGDNEYVFAVGAARATFKKPSDHELGMEEVSRLRKFLRDAEPEPTVEESMQPRRMIVVIDHHAAHIYRDLGESEPVEEETVRPYDPYHFHHHLIHKKEAHYRGDRVPEENSYYEAVAQDLAHAVEIVILGHGKGTSSAAVSLNQYLESHHRELFRRVLATDDVDLSALTEPEIEVLAKKHMITVV